MAAVEAWPFADQSVDLVAVHGGLHPLDDPYPGLSEMARVARRLVVVTEPARASITRLAIRLGLALETEEAGNRVARMEPSEVAAFLEARGFAVLRAQRYAMYYPHHPGAVFSLLSRPLVFPVVRAGWRLANTLVGRVGNKMVVVAGRDRSGRRASPCAHQPVTAVGRNKAFRMAVKGRFGDITGRLDRRPDVQLVNDEARSYLSRSPSRYDLIQISLIDTWAATAAASTVLSRLTRRRTAKAATGVANDRATPAEMDAPSAAVSTWWPTPVPPRTPLHLLT